MPRVIGGPIVGQDIASEGPDRMKVGTGTVLLIRVRSVDVVEEDLVPEANP